MGSKKKTPAINTSSTADIAFLLLCYFLMTTTMGSQTGLQRLLPPSQENQKTKDAKVKQRNILIVRVNNSNKVFAGEDIVDVKTQLKVKVKDFLSINRPDNEELPELVETTIEGYPRNGGKAGVSQGVISLQCADGTSYSTYIEVQNELVKAVNEIRDEQSKDLFGKPYAALGKTQQDIIKKVVPQNISEANPKKTGKK